MFNFQIITSLDGLRVVEKRDNHLVKELKVESRI